MYRGDTLLDLLFAKAAQVINLSWLAACSFCRLLITFASNLDPDHSVGPNLDQKLSDTQMVFLKEFFGKVHFESMKNYPACKELKKHI